MRGDSSFSPKKKTIPIICLKPVIACVGAFVKALDIGTSIIICRNNAAAWLMGNIFITVCTEDGSDPIGIYIPVKKPISVPIIVLALEKHYCF